MITVLLIVLPFVAALALTVLKGNLARIVALLASVVELGLAIAALTQFNVTGGTQFLVNVPWVPLLGITFKVGMDGISLLMVLLTAVLTPLIILTTLKKEIANAGLFFALVLAMQAGLMGVFTALDGFLFYIFWEVVLFPIYFICLLWGGANRVPVTIKFFIYTLTGSLLMLVALIYLYFQTPGNHTFELSALSGLHLGAKEQGFVFIAFFLAFAIKMPIFPFHTWQPDTYAEAPAEGTMLLSALMSKMGVYALIRILLPLAPLGLFQYGKAAAILSIIGIVYASLIALRQNDWKRVIAYSSIAHMGLIGAAIFTFSAIGIQGAVVQMISHGVNAIALFFIIDLIERRTGTRKLDELGGVRLVAPVLAGYFLIATMANIALPLTNGFVGELMMMIGVFGYSFWFALVAGLGTILGAWYMLSAYQKSILGETKHATQHIKDLILEEKLVLIPLVILIFAVGIYSKPITDIAKPAIDILLLSIKH